MLALLFEGMTKIHTVTYKAIITSKTLKNLLKTLKTVKNSLKNSSKNKFVWDIEVTRQWNKKLGIRNSILKTDFLNDWYSKIPGFGTGFLVPNQRKNLKTEKFILVCGCFSDIYMD